MRKFCYNQMRLLSIVTVILTFPIFIGLAQVPTNEQDRNQMLNQLGISLPVLPSKLNDLHKSAGTWPSDKSNPEGNWIDSSGHIDTSDWLAFFDFAKKASKKDKK